MNKAKSAREPFTAESLFYFILETLFLSMQNFDSVATSRLALRWMCQSPRTGWARRITPM